MREEFVQERGGFEEGAARRDTEGVAEGGAEVQARAARGWEFLDVAVRGGRCDEEWTLRAEPAAGMGMRAV